MFSTATVTNTQFVKLRLPKAGVKMFLQEVEPSTEESLSRRLIKLRTHICIGTIRNSLYSGRVKQIATKRTQGCYSDSSKTKVNLRVHVVLVTGFGSAETSEEGGSILLTSFRVQLGHRASHPTRHESAPKPLWKPQISGHKKDELTGD